MEDYDQLPADAISKKVGSEAGDYWTPERIRKARPAKHPVLSRDKAREGVKKRTRKDHDQG